MTSGQKLPRHIWTYWHQGFDTSPIVVRNSIKQLKRLNNGWDFHLLDESSVHYQDVQQSIRENVWSKMRIAHRSDLLRTHLLHKFGGVWLDPTVFCTEPIGEWIDEYLSSGIFMFSDPGRDRIISNWFIAAYPGNEILLRLLIALREYWNKNSFRNLGLSQKTSLEKCLHRVFGQTPTLTRFWFHPVVKNLFRLYPYFVYHYMFNYILTQHEKLAIQWDLTPKVSALPPHQIQNKGLLRKLDEEAKIWIETPNSPVHKLTWKLGSSSIPDNSVLAYLFQYYGHD